MSVISMSIGILSGTSPYLTVTFLIVMRSIWSPLPCSSVAGFASSALGSSAGAFSSASFATSLFSSGSPAAFAAIWRKFDAVVSLYTTSPSRSTDSMRTFLPENSDVTARSASNLSSDTAFFSEKFVGLASCISPTWSVPTYGLSPNSPRLNPVPVICGTATLATPFTTGPIQSGSARSATTVSTTMESTITTIAFSSFFISFPPLLFWCGGPTRWFPLPSRWPSSVRQIS